MCIEADQNKGIEIQYRRALELRSPRLYLLRRCRNRLEQASEFSGLTDGWEIER